MTKEDRMEWLMTSAGYKTTVVNDGRVDKKGRKVGHYATIEPLVLTDTLLGFEVSLYPTRDGKHYSSCRAGTLVATWEEAFALGEKKLAAYVRKVAKAAKAVA